MLRKVARSRLDEPHFAVNFHTCANGIPIRFDSPQVKCDGTPAPGAVVPENAHLRAEAALQNQIQVAVAVEIGHGKRPAVVRHIQAAHTREIVIAVAVSYVKDIWLPTGLTVLLMRRLAEGVPAVLICCVG